MRHARWTTLLALAAASAGAQTNLVVNPGTIDLPDGGLSGEGWTPSTALRTVRWDNDGRLFANRTHPGPPDGGTGYFRGNGACAQAFQPVDLSASLALIQAGAAVVTLGGWFGGWGNQDDRAEAILRVFDASGGFLGLVSAGPVSKLERGSTSGLFLREARAWLPPSARRAELEVRCSREGPGPVNDGYFDELYLRLEPFDGGARELSPLEPPLTFGCLPDAGSDGGALTADGGGLDAGAAPGGADGGGDDAGAGPGGVDGGGVDAADGGALLDPEPLEAARYDVGCGCTQSGAVTGLLLGVGLLARRRRGG